MRLGGVMRSFRPGQGGRLLLWTGPPGTGVNEHGKSPLSIMEIPHPRAARLGELVHVRASGLLCCPAGLGERVG